MEIVINLWIFGRWQSFFLIVAMSARMKKKKNQTTAKPTTATKVVDDIFRMQYSS